MASMARAGRARLLLYYALLVLGCSRASAPAETAAPVDGGADAPIAPGRSFHVFNAIGAPGTPDLGPYGLEPINLVYASAIWMKADASAPAADADVQRIAAGARANGILTCLDVEQWDIDGRSAPAATVDTGVQDYVGLATSFAADAPGIPFGYYGLPPIRDVNLAAPGTPAFLAWQRANDRTASIARAVTISFPSLYTFTTNPAVWVTYARANVAEARRVAPGLPLYAFIWPRYHEGTPTALQPLDGPYWKVQLETLAGIADGVVIWDTSKLPWDEGAAWWQETKAFIAACDAAGGKCKP